MRAPSVAGRCETRIEMTMRCILLAVLLVGISGAAVGPGTHGGCESAGWLRHGAYCYHVAGALPPALPLAQAEEWCSNLTMPVLVVNPDNSTTQVNFTDTAQLASFHSPNEMTDFFNAASLALSGNHGSGTYEFWLGCSEAGGVWSWSDST